MTTVLGYLRVGVPLDSLGATERGVLRVDPEVTSSTFGLPLTLIPHMIHHACSHSRAAKGAHI